MCVLVSTTNQQDISREGPSRQFINGHDASVDAEDGSMIANEEVLDWVADGASDR